MKAHTDEGVKEDQNTSSPNFVSEDTGNQRHLSQSHDTNNGTPESNQSEFLKNTVLLLLPILAVALQAILSPWLRVLDNRLQLLFAYLLILTPVLLVLLFFGQKRQLILRGAVGVLVLLSTALAIFWVKAWKEQRTIYFIVDASENMEGVMANIETKLLLRTQHLSRNVDVGLVVFGGGLSGQSECEDIYPMNVITAADEGLDELRSTFSVLAELPPSGAGTLQNAVVFSVEQLAGRKGEHELVIITSGVDERCGKLDRNAVDAVARERGVGRLNIQVLTVGDVTAEDTLRLYDFSNSYQVVPSPADLPAAIDATLLNAAAPYSLYYGESHYR